MNAQTNTVSSVERALDVVELLRERGTARLSSVARELDLSKSTAHRHLKTLESRGYVVETDEGYALSLQFLDLGEFTRTRRPAYQLAMEKVDELAHRTDERAQFMVEEHGRAVYVYRKTGNHAVKADSYPGKRVPVHASAAGLAILSKLPRSRVEEIIDQHGLEALTPQTITDRDTLFAELDTVRERGYSINDQGTIEGLRAIGAPVTDADGEVIGGLSISGPINRMRGERFEEEFPSLLLGATNELELNIAYQ
ncbi:transcriptional regulator, IclR family [Halogranum gelatinilyticum]|uniref:Transcriptional regulator, IclR family n=1 Tax=Halogranum gelatinilyticum TaxID=660521 RepID=A0A1G9SH76_9EURY|nr:IclR family transcriptional regulator [Halogranum gelatinilyticum]SDM34846.1 transcriptional regulator, IclR family [Halogranum gelatinilyticum]